MTQFKMNIDLELLKKQIKILTEVSYDFCPGPEGLHEGIEGVLNLLGAIRDQIEPPPLKVEICCCCDGGYNEVSRKAIISDDQIGHDIEYKPCSCDCHGEDEGWRTG